MFYFGFVLLNFYGQTIEINIELIKLKLKNCTSNQNRSPPSDLFITLNVQSFRIFRFCHKDADKCCFDRRRAGFVTDAVADVSGTPHSDCALLYVFFFRLFSSRCSRIFFSPFYDLIVDTWSKGMHRFSQPSFWTSASKTYLRASSVDYCSYSIEKPDNFIGSPFPRRLMSGESCCFTYACTPIEKKKGRLAHLSSGAVFTLRALVYGEPSR